MLPPELAIAPFWPLGGKRIETLPIKDMSQLLAEIQQSRLSREAIDARLTDPAAEDGDSFDPRD